MAVKINEQRATKTFQTMPSLKDTYHLTECLKKDAHSSVYLATHRQEKQQVIVKILGTAAVQDPTIPKRFQREAKILRGLDHPNIIKLLSADAAETEAWIAFEYFPSENLRALLRDANLTEEKKLQFTHQLLTGLAYAHRQKIIHRDIKPENILINKQARLKIADFGLAQVQNEAGVTQKSSIVGTPGYMSPEQISGEKLTPQSDLFSAGIVIFELFSGKNPFVGKDISETINNILSKNINDLFTPDKNLPPAIQPVLKKVLQRKPADRYATAGAMLADLPAVSVPTVSPPDDPDPTKRQTAFSRQQLWLLLLIPLLLLAFFFSGIFSSSPPADGNIKSSDEPILRDTSSTPLVADTIPIATDSSHDLPMLNTQMDTILTTRDRPPVRESLQEAATKAAEEDNLPPATEPLPGTLTIRCLPWADVYIDDKRIDTTPLDGPISLQPGSYQLVLAHPGYPLYREEIAISAAQQLTVQVNMDTLFGFLDCQVYPWATIILDGDSLGQTPLSAPLKLLPGARHLKLLNPMFPSLEKFITITRRETLRVNFNLEAENFP